MVWNSGNYQKPEKKSCGVFNQDVVGLRTDLKKKKKKEQILNLVS